MPANSTAPQRESVPTLSIVPPATHERMPLGALFALAMAGFLTVLTEALPAGLLPQIAHDLSVSQAMVGQLVTIYAIGSLVAAIPLIALTQRWRRRPLLLLAIAGFAIANTATTISTDYAVTLVARFLAGVSAGVLWALLAGYAARMVPEHRKGRAIAIAMAGIPLALSIGIPAGTLLGTMVGWRLCFAIMSVLALLLMAWVRFKIPDFANQANCVRLSLKHVITIPGVGPILFVVLTFVLAHHLLYTYIAPFLANAGMQEQTDLVLLIFGATSLLGIWAIGAMIDRHLRVLTLASTCLFALAALLLHLAGDDVRVIYGAVAIWGLAFGGAPTLFQTALATAAGEAADVAQSMLVTGWNLAIAGGGLIGGLLLAQSGAGMFAPAVLALLLASFVMIWFARKHGFSNPAH